MKLELFESVKKLYELELYDDLLFYFELNIHDNKLSDILRIDEEAYIYLCIAEAQFQTSKFSQSAKYYDRAIKSLAVMRRQNAENRYEHIINSAELRFRMHKALLKERKVEEAIRCLEGIPKTELTPKILYAIAKLNLAHRRPARLLVPYSTKITNSFRNVVDQVPEALLCKSFLVLSGNAKNDEELLPGRLSNSETTSWFFAKQAEAECNFSLAIQALNKPSFSNNYMLTIELAYFYRVIGDRKKALECYDRAHSLNTSYTCGMGSYAYLLAQAKMSRDLEVLAQHLMNANPLSSESFIAYGHMARLQRRGSKGAPQFAQRAVALALASDNNRLKAEALLLRALVHLDAKHRETETFLQEAVSNDRTNVDTYDTHIRYLVHQKRSSEAHRIAKSALNFLGEDNQRAQFFMAYLLAEDVSTSADAISILEGVTEKAPYLIDAVFLLARLYEKHQLFECGIKLLKKFSEIHVDAQIHRMLGDFLAKTNQVDLACSEYRLALSSTIPDPKALLALNAINSSNFTPNNLATPEFTGNNGNNNSSNNSSNSSTVFNNRGPSAPVAPVRMRRIAQAHRRYQSRRTAAPSNSSLSESPTAATSANPASFEFLLPPRFDDVGSGELTSPDTNGSAVSSQSQLSGRIANDNI